MNSQISSIADFVLQLPNDIFLIQEEALLTISLLVLITVAASTIISRIVSSFGLGIIFCLIIYTSWTSFNNLNDPIELFSGLLVLDRLGLFSKMIFSLSGLLATIIYFTQKSEPFSPAFPILIVCSILGLDFLVMSNHWVVVFLSLETVSIASYLLVSLGKKTERAEAGIKYILFGAAASAIMLYGISWIYGVGGTLYLEGNANSMLIVGPIFVLVISGLLFKTTGFPFHFWAPDVYQGTSSQLLPFLSYAPKVGAFVILYKITQIPIFIDSSWVLPILALVAIVSLAIGNWGALRQDNSLRLLAYSGIAQTGLILTGISCGILAFEAIIFYIGIYLFMNFSAFYLLSLVGVRTGSFSIKSMQGLGGKDPFWGVMLLVSLVALAGLPPTIGFSGKLLIFSALWDSYIQTGNQTFVILLGAAGAFTLTSFFFYLKIPFYIFIKQGTSNQAVDLRINEKLLALLLTAPLIILFFMPEQINNLVKLINLVV